MTLRPLSIAMVVLLGATSFSPPLRAQDMQVMMKWSAADVIKYHIVGVYSYTPTV